MDMVEKHGIVWQQMNGFVLMISTLTVIQMLSLNQMVQPKDADSMKKYADSVMQTEPVVELTVNLSAQDDSLNVGDTLFLNAEPLGIKTMITLNGISGNPLTNNSPMTVTLDNSKLSKRDINYEMSDKIRLANRNNVLLNKAFKKQEAKLSKATESIKTAS
ncbi:hypothetical protein CPR19081_DFPECDIO_01086 [Companilactobacillus paralimentarius]